MPATPGRYATCNADRLTCRAAHRCRRRLLRSALCIAGRGRLDDRDDSGGYTRHREFGGEFGR